MAEYSAGFVYEKVSFELQPWTDHDTSVPCSVKMISSVMAMGTLLLGNFMLTCVVNFEHGSLGSSHDPRKRTLINRLQSTVAMSMMISMNVAMPVFLLRVWLGPLPAWTHSLLYISFCQDFCGMITVLCLVEAMLLRYLSVHTWKRLPPFNEDYTTAYLRLTNFFIALFIMVLSHFTGELDSASTKTFAGLHPFMSKRPLFGVM